MFTGPGLREPIDLIGDRAARTPPRDLTPIVSLSDAALPWSDLSSIMRILRDTKVCRPGTQTATTNAPGGGRRHRGGVYQGLESSELKETGIRESRAEKAGQEKAGAGAPGARQGEASAS